MKASTSASSCLAVLAIFAARAFAQTTTVTDPRIATWQVSRSGAYARVWETAADKTANNAVTTWPRSGLTNRGGGQSTPTYSDVARVVYSANYVYIYTTGLASYTMGPWLEANGNLFGMWPTNRGAIHQIPRSPTIPTTKTLTRGVGGVLVNGVYLWNNGDAQSYSATTGQVSFNGQGIWNRLAGVAEVATFDGGNAHQPTNGQYHNHINPRALRYQLGDAVSYDSSTKTYAETTPTRHSPIIGWANDGLPIYGPYGYSDPTSAASGVRRMVSGFIKRDGTSGTTNLASTGRTTLPTWSASVQGRSAALGSTQYGPPVNATYPLGTFAEDYDYLGDLGKTQGVDFDLNRQNVRFGVTPEFPSGTYAYFTCLDASGNSVFPDIIGQEFFGTPSTMQGTVNSVDETVTEYTRGSEAAKIAVTAVATGANVLVSWSSIDGGTYAIATSSDGGTFTNLASGVTSAGLTTTYTTSTVANYYRVTLTAVASYDTRGNGGVSGVNGSGSVQYQTTPSSSTGGTSSGSTGGSSGGTSAGSSSGGGTSSGPSGGSTSTGSSQTGTSTGTGTTTTDIPPIGTSGTARLVNVATRVQVGGAAGTPVSGFVISGAGAKRMLVRAVGPTLAAFGVSGALADPGVSLVSGATILALNDDWKATDAATISASGAFALNSASKDAALVSTLAAGAYSAPVTTNGGSGVTLLEVYDADSTASGEARLINASTRAFVGTGEQVLIPGFVISGTGTVKLLVRAVGPTLANFGLGGTLADPQLTLYRGDVAVANNDNWGSASNASDIASAAAKTGAFALASGSKDAALLATLEAGSYTAVVSGVGGATGTALVEIYVVE